MNLNILLWNTDERHHVDHVTSLVEEHEINLVILLENNGNDVDMENSLRIINPIFKLAKSLIFTKAKVFYSVTGATVNEISAHNRCGIYKIDIEDHPSYLLAIVHFPSKVNWGNPNDHLSLCFEIRTLIETAERDHDTTNTLVVGDFNMNPFEDGLISAIGLQNVRSRRIAKLNDRVVQGNRYRFFYNPMWRFLSDFQPTESVQGTLYYNSYTPINHYWNLYDQVMMRPAVIDNFEHDELKILTTIQGMSLMSVKKGITYPNRKPYSDHLPITFRLKLQKNEKPVA